MSDFKKRMGLNQVNQEQSRAQFINRIDVSIFRWLQSNEGMIFFDENFIWWISEQLGKPWGDSVHPRDFGSGYYSSMTLTVMAEGDFYKTLEIIEKCYQYMEEGKAKEIYNRYHFNDSEDITIQKFNERIERIILLSETDIGVFWKSGKFYISGAPELDKALISDQLEWLNFYPEVKKQFSVALDHYKKSPQLTSAGKDTITNSYTTMELLAKKILKNDKNFDKNSDDLIKKIKLPKEYGNVVHWYKQIANEYASRHAGSEPSHNEVEAFLYFTGLLIRLVIQSLESNKD